MHIPLPNEIRPATGLVIFIFWFFSLIFTSVQLATLTHLQHIEPRLATEYLDSDQIIDVSVIVALVSQSSKAKVMKIVTSNKFAPFFHAFSSMHWKSLLNQFDWYGQSARLDQDSIPLL